MISSILQYSCSALGPTPPCSPLHPASLSPSLGSARPGPAPTHSPGRSRCVVSPGTRRSPCTCLGPRSRRCRESRGWCLGRGPRVRGWGRGAARDPGRPRCFACAVWPSRAGGLSCAVCPGRSTNIYKSRNDKRVKFKNCIRLFFSSSAPVGFWCVSRVHGPTPKATGDKTESKHRALLLCIPPPWLSQEESTCTIV